MTDNQNICRITVVSTKMLSQLYVTDTVTNRDDITIFSYLRKYTIHYRCNRYDFKQFYLCEFKMSM